MTGEVTLRGEVLPVGGIREKILAAKRYGVFNVILPADNRMETKEMPGGVLKGMNLLFVDKLDDVFRSALDDGGTDAPGKV